MGLHPPRSGSGDTRSRDRRTVLLQSVRAKILLSEIPPGAALDEEALAAEFGVSRTPVREVCAQLIAEGIVLRRNGRGAFVPDIDVTRIHAFFEAAEVLLPELFAQACARITEDEIAVLEAQLDVIRAHKEDTNPNERILNYLAFMELCADCARNRYLTTFGKHLMREHCRIVTGVGRSDIRRAATPENIGASIASYERLFDAIRDGDASTLDEAVRGRLAVSKALILEMIGM